MGMSLAFLKSVWESGASLSTVMFNAACWSRSSLTPQ